MEGSEKTTLVVEVPVHAGEGIRSVKDVSMWEQLSFAALMQRHWADNQVSCTVSFDPETEGNQIKNALDYFQYQLKGISFLPRMEKGAYKQMPYEAITKEKYKEIVSNLKPLDFSKVSESAIPEKFCDGEVCEIGEERSKTVLSKT